MRQDARENRERILVAAEAVFGASGATGSTEEVARRAGVGVATVFRHFPTKEALIEAALLRHFAHLEERARALAVDPDPAAALAALVRVMVASGATKLTLATALAPGGEHPPSVTAASRRLRSVVQVVLRRAQECGAARPAVRVDEVYLLVRALAHASATMRPRPGALHRAVDIVLAGLSVPGSG
jgi:AcrR family transcriptional regulator